MADIVPPSIPRAKAPCRTCAETVRTTRYCARSRCYCGHETCPAFESYVDPYAQPFHDAPVKVNAHAKSWAEREGATWIDSL